jgi:hypothetical protein
VSTLALGRHIFIIDAFKVLHNFMARTRYTSFAGFEYRGTVDRRTSDPWYFGDKVSLFCITIENRIHLFYNLQSLGDQFARWTSTSRVVQQ